jgi:ribosomal protein S18 acetylase RimI-like enzyme
MEVSYMKSSIKLLTLALAMTLATQSTAMSRFLRMGQAVKTSFNNGKFFARSAFANMRNSFKSSSLFKRFATNARPAAFSMPKMRNRLFAQQALLNGGMAALCNTVSTEAINTTNEKYSIVDYDKERDKEELLNLCASERRWLVDFNVENLIQNSYRIKVYLDDGKFAGFITYKKIDATSGVIGLLAVKNKFRKRGIAQKLTQTAINDLKYLGLKKIYVSAYIQNTSAILLYTKLGFKVVGVYAGTLATYVIE